jgi:hypothetical protein
VSEPGVKELWGAALQPSCDGASYSQPAHLHSHGQPAHQQSKTVLQCARDRACRTAEPVSTAVNLARGRAAIAGAGPEGWPLPAPLLNCPTHLAGSRPAAQSTAQSSTCKHPWFTAPTTRKVREAHRCVNMQHGSAHHLAVPGRSAPSAGVPRRATARRGTVGTHSMRASSNPWDAGTAARLAVHCCSAV